MKNRTDRSSAGCFWNALRAALGVPSRSRSMAFAGCIAAVAWLASEPARAQTLGSLFPELATVVASDGASLEQFGTAVALDGDTLAVGVPLDAVGSNSSQGSVRVFVRSGSGWSAQATLVASDGAAGDYFGMSVALSGNTLAVAVPYDTVGANQGQGSVRIFVRNGATWTAQQTITAADGAVADGFGSSISLVGDTLAVGVPYDDVGSTANQGTVRIFTRNRGNWTAQATLAAADGALADIFGWAIDLSSDMLVVGVPQDDVGSNSGQGSMHLFAREAGGWISRAVVTAGDGTMNDFFGYSVSLSGELVAVGVPNDDFGFIGNAGSVRIYSIDGSTVTLQKTVVAPDAAVGDVFGSQVALDGDTLAVSVPLDDVGANPEQGTVRMFVRASSGWTAQAMLKSGDGALLESFGESLSLSGSTLAVGYRFDDVGSNAEQGSVRIYGNHRVFNETRNTYWNSLNDAVLGGVAGDRLVVGAAAFAQANDIVDAQQTRYTFVAVEPIAIPQHVLMRVATNTVFEKSPDVAAGGLTVEGKLIAPASGTLAFQQMTIANEGQFMQRESTIVVNEGLVTAGGGACYLQGPILAETVSTAVGGQNRCAGDTDVFADYTNAGTTVVQRGILYIYGTLVNTGTLTGEVDNGFLPPAPGDGYSIGGDYAVSADSSIVLPNPVWWLRVGGSFDMAINSAARFVMDQATLEMSGVGDEPSQSLEVFARDLGAIDDGFATTNYLVGALRIRAGANVSLEDNHNNAPGKTAEAIYTNELFVPAGATLTTNGYRIYTRAATIAGTVSNPADIIVVPDAPPCPADLFPDGIVNAADLSALLVNWGPCSGSCIADIDGDGQVGASDLSLLLASWGPCAAD